MSLDPMPSAAELLEMHRKRTAERETKNARASDAPLIAAQPARPGGEVGVIQIGNPPIAVRRGPSLDLVLLFPPRSKKNHKAHYAAQSTGYRKFRNAVVRHLESFRAELQLPLPDIAYNLAAVFYTDNDAADTLGLLQGLADALENAGVVTNDRVFRTFDGSDQVLDKLRPRVELRITPIIRD